MTARTWNAHGTSDDFVDGAERLRRLRRLSGIAGIMDTAIRIPGTGIRFGADSIMGLLPLIGDGAGAIVGLYIVNEARRLACRRKSLREWLATSPWMLLWAVFLSSVICSIFISNRTAVMSI